MIPSVPQLQEILKKINDGINWIIERLREFPGWVRHALDHWYIPGFIADGVCWCMQKVIDLANWILGKLRDVLVGLAAPFVFIAHASAWSDIGGEASGVQGVLNLKANSIKDYWKGSAADAYGRAAQPQADAAGAIKKIADDTRKLDRPDALGQGGGRRGPARTRGEGRRRRGPEGAAAAAVHSGVTAAAIIAAVAALTALVAAEGNALAAINAAATDNSKFPGGHWPVAVTGNFNDGTVTDGDNDWSVVDR